MKLEIDKKEIWKAKDELTKIKTYSATMHYGFEKGIEFALEQVKNKAFVLYGEKNKIMQEVIEKYEAKLEFLDKNLDKTRHLMDRDVFEMMQNVKTLLEEVVSDFRALANEVQRKQKTTKHP